MIFNDLATTTKAMQDLQRKTAIKNNITKQESIDGKYRLLLFQANNCVDIIVYLYAKANIQPSDDVLSALSNLFNSFESTIESGLASNEGVNNTDNQYKALQADLKKEWAKQYAALTGSTINTLEAISGIDPEGVNSCIQSIQAAETWDLDISKYKHMNAGLEKATQLITGLGLDEEIIQFLQKTNDGKATLKDLNERVLAWIHDENLEQKIRVSFAKMN